MATTLADFTNDSSKKVLCDIEVADKLKHLYQRAVTVNDNGVGAGTNVLVKIEWDALEDARDGKTTLTGNDIRVYDSDGTTELIHMVENPGQASTIIWVNMPSLSVGDNTIYLRYGNPTLQNTSNIRVLATTNYPNSPFLDTTTNGEQLITWLNSQQPFPSWQFNDSARGNIYHWNDWFSPDLRRVSTKSLPCFRTNSNTDLYTYEFNGSNTRLDSDGLFDIVIPSNTYYEIFLAEARISSKASNYAIGKAGAGTFSTNNDLGMGYANDTTFRFSQWANDVDYTVPAYSSQTFRVWNSLVTNTSVHTSTGFTTGRWLNLNGVNVSSGVDATPFASNQVISVGTAFSSSYYHGNIGDVIIFRGVLKSDGRDKIYEYLNKKYDTVTQPSASMASRTDVTAPSYTAYGPLLRSFNRNQENALYGAPKQDRSVVTIDNILEKTITTGGPAENWDTSSIKNAGNCRGFYSRSVTASTTQLVDEVTIERNDGTTNVHKMDTFNYVNEAQGTSTIASPESDYTVDDFYVADASALDLSNCYFEYTDGTVTYTINFDDTETTLTDGLNQIRAKKSAYTKTGTGDWGDVTTKRVAVQTSSGTTAVEYGYSTLQADRDLYFNENQTAKITYHITDDDWATKTSVNVLTGNIKRKSSQSRNWELNLTHLYDNVKELTFGELPAFPYQKWVYENYYNNLEHNYLASEFNLSQWNLGGGTTYNGTVEDPFGGNKAYSFTQTASSATIENSNDTMYVNASQNHTFSIYLKTLSGTPASESLYIDWYNLSGTLISTTSASISLTTSWARYSVSGISPATAFRAKVRLPENQNATYAVYGPMIQQSSTARTFIDATEQGYTALFKQVLQFVGYADTQIDIDLGKFGECFYEASTILTTYSGDVREYPYYNTRPRNFTIRDTETVEQVVNNLCKITFSSISHGADGKIRIRSFDKTILNAETTKIRDNTVIDYSEYENDGEMYNRMTFIPWEGQLFSQNYIALDYSALGFGVSSFNELEQDFISTSNNTSFGYNFLDEVGYNSYLVYKFVEDMTAPVFANGDISLTERKMVDYDYDDRGAIKQSKLVCRWTNNDISNTEYLYELQSQIDTIQYVDYGAPEFLRYAFTTVSEDDVIDVQYRVPPNYTGGTPDMVRYVNYESIQNNGVQEFTVHLKGTDYRVGLDPYFAAPSFLDLAKAVSTTPDIYTITTMFIPDIEMLENINVLTPLKDRKDTVVIQKVIDFDGTKINFDLTLRTV